MRIDITPELLEESKGSKKVGSHHPVIRIQKPRVEATPVGGMDFQQLLQNIYDAVLITELGGEIVMVNIRANQFFLAEPGQLTHYNVLGLVCGAEASLLPTILETLEGNRFVLMQAYCARLDGSVFPTEISVNRLQLGGKERLSFFVRDISLRAEQEERLRTGYTALQNASSAIAITGNNAEIEYCNPAFLCFFGLPEGVATGSRNMREFLCEPERADEVLATVGQGQTWAGELALKRVDGSTFFGHASITANFNNDGEQVGTVVSVLDITPQKLAQQQLEAYASELHEKNTQMQEDLNVACELHQAFLPGEFRVFPRRAKPEQIQLRFRNLYCPSGTIGGDFFDIREISDHEVALFIADVMGHGIRSALVVATIRGLLEELRPLAYDPGALLTQLNATYTAIFKQMGGDVTFATAFFATIDTHTGILRYANASHPTPYLLRPGRNILQQLDSPRSAALGLFGEAKYVSTDFQLDAKDLLLLYTDGLCEAESKARELYETRRFEEALRARIHLPAEELLDEILSDAQEFSGSESFEDDVCLLAAQFVKLAGKSDQGF